MKSFLTHLSQINPRQPPLIQNHKQCSREDNEPMSDIPKHDRKEEGEGDDCKKTRVHFLIGCGAICVHDALEALGELVGADEGGRSLACAHFV